MTTSFPSKATTTTTMLSSLYLALLILLVLVALPLPHTVVADSTADTECSVDTSAPDPNLVEMKYDLDDGNGEQTFMAYVEPDVSTFYKNSDKDSDADSQEQKYQKVVPKFNGLAGRFINMSNQRLTFYWESRKNGPAHVMRIYDPFSNGGTGTFPGHRFFFTPEDDPTKRVQEFVVKDYPNNYYVYDPYKVEGDPEQTEKNLQGNLTKDERAQYDKWVKTLKFNEVYMNTTGE